MIGGADKSQNRFITNRLMRCSIFVSVQTCLFVAVFLRTTKLDQGQEKGGLIAAS